MKRYLLFGILLLYFTPASPQSGQKITGKSPVKVIRAGIPPASQSVKAIPDLVIKDEVFTDPNGNNVIDADEICFVKFNIENLGKGKANKVYVRISQKNQDISGLVFTPEITIGTIEPGAVKNVSVQLEGKMDLTDGIAELKFEALEDLGFDAYPLEMKIETHPFQPPNIVVAEAVFSTEEGGKIKLNSKTNLKILVQNTGNGDAKEVHVSFSFPNTNCIVLDTNKFQFAELKKGQAMELDFPFTTTRRYSANSIPVSIDLSESYCKYARDTVVNVSLDQTLVAQNKVVIAAIPATETFIQKASLTSDIDKNIPINPQKNPNKFALVIGNEEYSKYQTGLTTEMNVVFAGNDAAIFAEYLTKTLGFEESNVYLLTDATAGQMNQKLDLISKLAAKTGGEAEILFYYAGHGMPDETTKIPYLMPVDVNGSNLSSGIKLSDFYQKLGQTGAKRITVILDACFSGGGRESGLLSARSVRIKPKEELLTGNTVSFTASSQEQSAMPYKIERHGLFTYFLLKKIQETKGDMTYGQLSDYLTKTISIESLKINQREQDPTVTVSEAVKEVWRGWNIRL